MTWVIFSLDLFFEYFAFSGLGSLCFRLTALSLQVYKFLFNRRNHDSKQHAGNEATNEKAVLAFCALRDFKVWMANDARVGRSCSLFSFFLLVGAATT